jgi:potassium efflux system protein
VEGATGAALSLLRPWESETLDVSAIEAAVSEAQGALASLPAPEVGAPVPALKSPLERRVSHLSDLLAVLRRQAEWRALREQLPALEEEARRDLGALRAGSASDGASGSGATQAELDAGRELLRFERKALEDTAKLPQSLEARQQEIPEATRLSRAAEDEARQTAAALEVELQKATEPGSQTALRVRVRNQALRQRLESERQAALSAELGVLDGRLRLARVRVELATLRAQRAEQRVALLQAEYQKGLERRQQEAALEVERARREAERATAQLPLGRFAADLASDLAAVELASVKLEREINDWQGELQREQERARQYQKHTAQLREFFGRLAGTQAAADRVKYAFAEVRAARRRVAAATDPRDTLTTLYLDKMEVEGRMLELEANVAARLTSIGRPLQGAERTEAEARAADFEAKMRVALSRKVELLDRAISLCTTWQTVRADRVALLDDAHRFILTRVFWIRDGDPLDHKLVGRAVDEARAVLAGLRHLPELTVRLWTRSQMLGRAGVIALLALLLVVLPAVLVGVRWRLRYRTRETTFRTGEIPTFAADGETDPPLWQVVLRVAAGACVWPAYMVALGAVTGALAQQEPMLGLVRTGLYAAAAVQLFRGLTRALLRPRGLLVAGLGFEGALAKKIDAWCRLAAAAGVMWVAWVVLVSEPLELAALGRLAWTAFFGSTTALVVFAYRRSSPIARLIHPSGTGPLWRNWRLLWTALVLGGAGIVVLDAAGYRFGAGWMAAGGGLTLGVLALLSLAYRVAGRVAEVYAQRLQHEGVTPALGEDGGPAATPADRPAQRTSEQDRELAARRDRLRGQVLRAVRAVLVLAGLALLVAIWDVDAQLLRTLDGIPVFGHAQGDEVASGLVYGDVLRSFVVFVVTVLVLRNLTGLFELAVFPRLPDDAGIRYTALTISRYAIFLVGFTVALLYLQVPFEKLGWIVAAVSVGIGFGLQDIVANFISGIIILIERPIRVGDIIRVGTTEGTVTQINIRATAVQNWDNQTLIIPNRHFISNELTNWTHTDRIVRFAMAVGVAYGTDISRVRGILLETVKAHELVRRDPEPSVWFIGFGASSLDFTLRFFVSDPKHILQVRSELGARIQKRLEEEGIEVPFSQHDVHLDLSSRDGDAGRRRVHAALKELDGNADAVAQD